MQEINDELKKDDKKHKKKDKKHKHKKKKHREDKDRGTSGVSVNDRDTGRNSGDDIEMIDLDKSEKKDKKHKKKKHKSERERERSSSASDDGGKDSIKATDVMEINDNGETVPVPEGAINDETPKR